MECKPLLDVATKNLFRKNAFRITGLQVDATLRDIAKHAEELKVLAELGHNPQPTASFSLHPTPAVEDIRDAIQRLKDPEKRLIDEFFWFWPQNFGESHSDPTIQALQKGDLATAIDICMSKRKDSTEGVVATHNLALVVHLKALDWENYWLRHEVDPVRRAKVTEYWKAAFYRWDQILTNEQLWENMFTRVRQLNEPNLTTSFVRRMRATVPAALVKINAELALAFAELNKLDVARLHIVLMHGTRENIAHVEEMSERVLTPARKRLREQVRSAKERADKDTSDGISVGRSLLEHARDTLALFDLFVSTNRHLRDDAFDEVAETCNRLQVIYHKATNDNEACLEFLRMVLPFAASIDLRQQIEKNIETLAQNIAAVRKDKVLYGSLRPISSVPSLSTINGIGFTLYGSTDLDPENGSCLATYYFVFFFIPIFPICRYRVIRNGNSYRFLGKAPLRDGDKWHLGIIIGLVTLFIIAGMISGNNQSTQSTNSTYRPAASAPSPRSYTPPDFNRQNSVATGSFAHSTLASEKAEIEAERTTVQALDAQIENLGRQIERERSYLDKTSEFEVDAFNTKVHRYQALVQEAQNAEAAFNRKVDNYNARVRANSR